MSSPAVHEVLAILPQAVARVDADLRTQWMEPAFFEKTGLVLELGQSLVHVLEPGRARDDIEVALREGRAFTGHVITCALRQVRVQIHPIDGPHSGSGAWVVFSAAGADDEIAFAQALQEIARAVGETLEIDAVCAAAAVAMVRCAHVCRAEVFLMDDAGTGLRRVAASDLPGALRPAMPQTASGLMADGALKHALATGQPQLGLYGGPPGTIFAAVPLAVQRRTAGVLVLFKEAGASFSVRELDLWAAAAGQLAVAVENARLLKETKAALQIRDEFMSIASHELKTPLTPLKMSLFTMERRLTQGLPVELTSVFKAKRQVDRLAGLVNDLLDASRLELGKLAVEAVPLELSHLVLEVVDEFRLAFDRQFDVVLPKERVWVMGDRDRLEQVLVNLLENAQKYSPQQEPIRIELERRRGEARMRVIDRGIGIPGTDQSQVFQRFYRARNASTKNFGGLGLGLFISRSILNLHGGELSVQSDEGRGSTFTVVLPHLTPREVRRMPKRVLLVERDPTQESEARHLLRTEGFEVLAAKDAAEALRKLSGAPIDLMVICSELANEHGMRETLSRSTASRGAPILFAGPDEAPAWAGMGAIRCSRPYRAEELGPLARQALGLASLELEHHPVEEAAVS